MSNTLSKDNKKLKISEGISMVLVGRFISTVCTLATAVELARLLIPKELGTFRQTQLVLVHLCLIFAMELGQAISYFVPKLKEKAKADSLIMQTFFYSFLMGLLAAGVIFFAADQIAARFNNPALVGLLRLFSLYPALALPALCLNPLLYTLDRQKNAMVIDIVFALGLASFTIIPVIFNAGVEVILISLLIFSGIKLIFSILYAIKILEIKKLSWQSSLTWAQVKYCIPLGSSRILPRLTQQLDKIIVSIFYLPHKFAIYSVGAIALPFINDLSTIIADVLFPKVTQMYHEKKTDDAMEVWHKSIKKVTLIIAPLAVFMFIFAREIVTFIFSKNYEMSAVPFQIFLLLLPVRCTNFNLLLKASGHTGSIFKIGCKVFLVNIALSLLFVKLIGYTGPAFAMVASVYYAAISRLIKIKKVFNTSFSKVFPWSSLVKRWAMALIPACLSLPVLYMGLADGLKILFGFIIFSCSYVALLLKFNLITKQDRLIIKKWVTLETITG